MRWVALRVDDGDSRAFASQFADRAGCDAWLARYRARLRAEASDDSRRRVRMDAVNPKYVLRTWMAHEAIVAAQRGDFSGIDRLLQLLRRPFDEQPGNDAWATTAPAVGRVDRAQLLLMIPRRARWDALWQRLGRYACRTTHFAALERQYCLQPAGTITPSPISTPCSRPSTSCATWRRTRTLAELALWLHDVVWEPMRDDCEATERGMGDGPPARPPRASPPCAALILETRHLAAASV